MSLMTTERRSLETARRVRFAPDRRRVSEKPDAAFRPATLMVLAVWMGVTTGLTELALLFARWRLVDATALSSVQLNQHALWMVPVSYAMVFGSFGLASALLLSIFRSRWSVILGVYVLSFISVFSLILSYRGLSSLATTALSAGIAFRISCRILRRAAQTRRLVACTLPGTIGLVAIFWGFGPSRETISERLLPTAPARAPNVLFIVLDTVRAESLDLYGYSRATSPALRRFAERGVRFDRARSPGTWTLPSHASMFTGRWPHELSTRLDRPLDATFPTLAEFLLQRGFDTAGFVANTFFCSRWYGLSRGFLHYEDVAVNPAEILRSANLGRAIARKFAPYDRDRPTAYFDRKDASAINKEFLDWLDNRPVGHPFFAFLNYYDAHDPYLSPSGSARHFGLTPSNRQESEMLRDWHRISKNPMDSHAVELVRDCYDDCIVDLDEQLGRLFSTLDSKGLLQNTIVVVTADHGEEFGEHGGFGHGQRLNSEVVRVPLLIVAPGSVPPGQIVADPVSLRDLPATILDLVRLSADSPFPGRSLSRHWRPTPERGSTPDDPVLTEIVDDDGKALVGSRRRRTIAEGALVYFNLGDGREQLFDTVSDPHEMRDLSKEESMDPIASHFRDLIRKLDSER